MPVDEFTHNDVLAKVTLPKDQAAFGYMGIGDPYP
jgi:hypothetical protein